MMTRFKPVSAISSKFQCQHIFTKAKAPPSVQTRLDQNERHQKTAKAANSLEGGSELEHRDWTSWDKDCNEIWNKNWTRSRTSH